MLIILSQTTDSHKDTKVFVKRWRGGNVLAIKVVVARKSVHEPARMGEEAQWP